MFACLDRKREDEQKRGGEVGNGRGGEGEMESRIVRSIEESGVVERGSSGEV
mgnify:CR=1 FL=1